MDSLTEANEARAAELRLELELYIKGETDTATFHMVIDRINADFYASL